MRRAVISITGLDQRKNQSRVLETPTTASINQSVKLNLNNGRMYHIQGSTGPSEMAGMPARNILIREGLEILLSEHFGRDARLPARNLSG